MQAQLLFDSSAVLSSSDLWWGVAVMLIAGVLVGLRTYVQRRAMPAAGAEGLSAS